MTIEEIAEQYKNRIIGGRLALLISRTELLNGEPLVYLAFLYASGEGHIRIRNEFELGTIVYPKINNWEVVKLTSVYDIKNRLHEVEFGD